MVEFSKICPRCLKTYTNGAIGNCGKCKVELLNIKHLSTETTNGFKTVIIKYEGDIRDRKKMMKKIYFQRRRQND